ncbi:hypothetical protein [Mixta calida]|nr:hypothetical protein [Mixta calida]
MGDSISLAMNIATLVLGVVAIAISSRGIWEMWHWLREQNKN